MAKIFGFNITRSRPDILVAGTEFAKRTLENGELLKAGTGSTIPDGQRFGNLPPVRRSKPGNSTSDEQGRAISNDPRENYWGVLPNKIEPKQAMFMVRAAMGGDLWQFWRLRENMLNTWPKYTMAQHQLREAVSYVRYVAQPFTMSEGEEPSETAIEKRDLVQRALNSMRPDPFNDEKGRCGMIYNFTDAVLAGIAMEEIIWKDPERVTGGKWQRLPKATAWTHPRHFTFNQQGSVVVFDTEHSLELGDYRKFGKGTGELPSPNKMICSQFMSRSGSSHVNGLAMQLVWWWCARQYGLDFVLVMAQNFGRPFVNVKYKPGMPDKEKMAIVSELVKGLGSRVLIHRDDTEIEIEPPQNLGDDNPQRWLVEESDREALYLLLGQTGSTISTPGKLGGEDTHNDVKHERVAGIAEWVAQNPLEQYARAVLRMNYGNEDECPTFKPDFTKPLDTAQVSQLLTGVSSSGLPVRVNELYAKVGLTPPQSGGESKEPDVVFHKGEVKVFSKPITDEEKQEKQFDQQMAIQQSQVTDQGQPNPKSNKNGKGKPESGKAKDVQQLLNFATEKDLDELESLVLAAERAPHPNGELTALNLKMQTLNRR